jgi:hypothetical protein
MLTVENFKRVLQMPCPVGAFATTADSGGMLAFGELSPGRVLTHG